MRLYTRQTAHRWCVKASAGWREWWLAMLPQPTAGRPPPLGLLAAGRTRQQAHPGMGRVKLDQAGAAS